MIWDAHGTFRACARPIVVLATFTACAGLAAAESPPFAVEVLEIARQFNSKLDFDQSLDRFDRLAQGLRGQLAASAPADIDASLALMAQYLYETNGFASKNTAPFDVYRGFDELLAKEQWNCLGMSVLYVALGEAVDLPFKLVAGPHHALAMYDDGQTVRYVETTQHGRVYTELTYLDGFLGGAFPCVDSVHFTPLDENQALAMLIVQSAGAAFPDSRVDEGKPYFERAIALDPENAEAHYALGLAELSADRVPEAVGQFQAALDSDPNLLGAYLALGNAYRAQGEVEMAVEVLRETIVICADYAEAHFNLGILLREQGQLEEAARALRRATELNPRDANVLYVLATLYEEMGAPKDALAAYQAAIRIQPRFTEAWINAGAIFQDAGDSKGALEAYKKAMRLDPTNTIILLNIGDVLLGQGQLDGAGRAYRRVLDFDAGSVDALAGLAQALAKRADSAADDASREQAFDEAGRLLQTAIDLAPADPLLHHDLAQIQLALEQRDAATASYRQYRALGGSPDAEFEKALGAGPEPPIRSDSPPTPEIPE